MVPRKQSVLTECPVDILYHLNGIHYSPEHFFWVGTKACSHMLCVTQRANECLCQEINQKDKSGVNVFITRKLHSKTHIGMHQIRLGA